MVQIKHIGIGNLHTKKSSVPEVSFFSYYISLFYFYMTSEQLSALKSTLSICSCMIIFCASLPMDVVILVIIIDNKNDNIQISEAQEIR